MFVNVLVKQFAICLGVVVSLLFNNMEVYSVGGYAVGYTVYCLPKNMCCACDPSVQLSVPSLGFV